MPAGKNHIMTCSVERQELGGTPYLISAFYGSSRINVVRLISEFDKFFNRHYIDFRACWFWKFVL